MNLKHLNDEMLIKETKRYVRQERELLTTILHHFRELERRRLFGKYSSLFEYAVGELGYSDEQAYRRTKAMRLINELPEIESKIEAGQINLTHVGLAHSLFKNEKKIGRPLSHETKLAVFDQIAGQSTRAAQTTLTKFASAAPRTRESIRPIGDGRNIATIELSDETLAQLERLKGLLAHQSPDLSYGELIAKLCQISTAQLDSARAPKRKVKLISRAEVRRQVWRRDGGACVNCKSTYAVEEDHIIPQASGGLDTLNNLRLLCRTCNQRAAIASFDLAKMQPYLMV